MAEVVLIIDNKVYSVDEKVAEYINTLENELEEYRQTCVRIIDKIDRARKDLNKERDYGTM